MPAEPASVFARRGQATCNGNHTPCSTRKIGRFGKRTTLEKCGRSVPGSVPRPLRSTADAIATVLQRRLQTLNVISLNFDRSPSDRPTGSALIFQLGQQLAILLGGTRQAANDGDELAAFPFFQAKLEPLS